MSPRSHYIVWTPFGEQTGWFEPFFISAAKHSPLFRTCRPCRGWVHKASALPRLRPLRADLSGVNEMSSLRDELFFRNFQK